MNILLYFFCMIFIILGNRFNVWCRKVNGCCIKINELGKGKIILSKQSRLERFPLTKYFFQVSALMEKFEKQFEDLDVQSGVMENSMSNSVTTSVPQVCFTNTITPYVLQTSNLY